MLSLEPQFLLSLGVALFLAIVFLQSGLDKIFDFSGNFFSEKYPPLSPAFLPNLFQGLW